MKTTLKSAAKDRMRFLEKLFLKSTLRLPASGFIVEAIAGVLDRYNPGFFCFEFLSKLADMHVHRTGLDIEGLVIAPDMLKKVFPGKNPAPGFHQGTEEVKFFGS